MQALKCSTYKFPENPFKEKTQEIENSVLKVETI